MQRTTAALIVTLLVNTAHLSLGFDGDPVPAVMDHRVKPPKRGNTTESDSIDLHRLLVEDYVRIKDITGEASTEAAGQCTAKVQNRYSDLKLAQKQEHHIQCRKVTAKVSFVKPTTIYSVLGSMATGGSGPSFLAAYLTVKCEPRSAGERFQKEMSYICPELARKIFSGEGEAYERRNHHEHSKKHDQSTNPAWQYNELGCANFNVAELNKIPKTKFTDVESLVCHLGEGEK